jgi:hypothetical protein
MAFFSQYSVYVVQANKTSYGSPKPSWSAFMERVDKLRL